MRAGIGQHPAKFDRFAHQCLGQIGAGNCGPAGKRGALLEDIERLQARYRELEAQMWVGESLNQSEILRQQWIAELATAIAFHLRRDWEQQEGQALGRYGADIDRLLLSLDDTLRTAFQTLQRDVDSYQRDLDGQVQRMHNQRLQGEMLLAALVQKLTQEWQRVETLPGSGSPPSPPEMPLASTMPTVVQARPARRGWRGWGLALGAALGLAGSNVAIALVLQPNRWDVGGWVPADGAGILLVLAVRTAFLWPLLWGLARARGLRPGFEAGRLWRSPQRADRRLLRLAIAGAILQFVSLVSFWGALGTLSPPAATAWFYLYPMLAALMEQALLGLERRSLPPLWLVGFGVGLVSIPWLWGGMVAAGLAAISFASLAIVAKVSYRHVAPAVFQAWIALGTLVLAMGALPFTVPAWSRLTPMALGWMATAALLTALGHALFELGGKWLGRKPAAFAGGSIPLLTALVAAIAGFPLSPWHLAGAFFGECRQQLVFVATSRRGTRSCLVGATGGRYNGRNGLPASAWIRSCLKNCFLKTAKKKLPTATIRP
ncbi:MAG: DMT family transporter [Oscillatoriales cyanobacterium SM2_1_8]|nr:DMT family transporter [Oscillatoriales cyanobacterium SM2_1_8]